MPQTERQAFWNQRYQADDYAYGTSPNVFFKEQLDKLPAGSILLPADGEGRNGVYAAECGWQVSAFDLSCEGKRKAEALAAKCGVSLRYLVGTLDDTGFQAASFDVLALIFAHFPAEQKSALHRRLLNLVKPGGTVILELFAKTHFALARQNPALGGPQSPDMMSSADEIRRDFSGCDILLLEETQTELHEGRYHNGLSSVVRFVGRKMCEAA